MQQITLNVTDKFIESVDKLSKDLDLPTGRVIAFGLVRIEEMMHLDPKGTKRLADVFSGKHGNGCRCPECNKPIPPGRPGRNPIDRN